MRSFRLVAPLLCLFFAVVGCGTSRHVRYAEQESSCPYPDLISIRYDPPAQDKYVYPVVVGLLGKQYPRAVYRNGGPTALVEAAYYTQLLALMQRSATTMPGPGSEASYFRICAGQQELRLLRQDQRPFFQALLRGLAPRSEAEKDLQRQLEILAEKY